MQEQKTKTTSTQAERKVVTVRNGIYPYQVPASGMTVAQIREEFGRTLNIGPETGALIDGTRIIDENTVVKEGQTLEFRRVSGQKGISSY